MEPSEFALSDSEFSRIKARVYDIAGISLSDAKRTLVLSRLSRIVRLLNLRGFDAYIDYLEKGASPGDAQEFVNALTTNLTRFFREDHHFDHLQKYVTGLVEAAPRVREKRLRIWSAGCSTGQEAYTIALSLMAAVPELKRWDFKILATDIDTSVIEKAATGIYPKTELAGLSRQRAALFEHTASEVRIPQAARSLVTFKPLNLMHNWPMSGPFNAIFCRNVAIYFDRPTQEQLFIRFSEMLSPKGFLYIGHSENIGAGSDRFRLVGKTIYQNNFQRSARTAA